MSAQEWKQQFEAELEKGSSARAEGNEGRARVCARRAVAILLAAYESQQGSAPGKKDAYTAIQQAIFQGELPAGVLEKLPHFLVRVEPGGRFPIDADLLSEARWIANQMIQDDWLA